MPARIASGLLAATSFANARASSRGANPCREAGKAPKLAYRSRCARRRSALPPCRRVGAQQPAHQHYAGHVGDQAHLISMTDSCAQEPTKRMSAPRQSWNPPPKATPCTAAITGTGISRQTLTSLAIWPKYFACPRPPAEGSSSARKHDPAYAFLCLELLFGRHERANIASPGRSCCLRASSARLRGLRADQS